MKGSNMAQDITKVSRSGAAALALVLVQAPAAHPAGAAVFIGERQTPALTYCGAQRAPLLDLQRQYDDIENSRRTKAVGAGVVAGAATLLGNFGGGFSGLGSRRGPSSAQVVTAVGVGLTVGVGAYIALKSQGIQDRRALAMAVDADAAEQLGQGRTTAGWARELARCRAFQVQDFQKRYAASDAPQKMTREKADIADAVRLDIALTDRVVGRQADLAKTFTQARAMAEGTTEARVLGGQGAAYAGTASATPLQLPSNSPLASQPPPPAAPPSRTVVTTLRSSPVHAAPSNKARVVANLPPRAEVATASTGVADGDWTPVTVNGQTGYTRAVNLSGPHRTGSTDPNALAPADNVREYNKVVLESRDEGPDRMRSLLTNFQ